MKLLELKLENYCQYEKYSVKFDDGISVLRGKNGRGKSNLMNAVFFALTGDSFIKNKTRSGMLKWGCDKGHVELTFSVHGSVYTVKRMLHSSSVTLTGDSLAKPIAKSNEASEFVAELIKADAEVLKISSFMPQSGANELVFGTKTERQKAFSRLFRLLKLEHERTELQKEFNKIPVYNDVSDFITKLLGEITILEQALKELDKNPDAKYLEDNKDKYKKMYDARDKQYTEKEFTEVKGKLLAGLHTNKALLDSLKRSQEELGDPVMITTEESEKYRKYKEFEKVCQEMLAAKEKVDNPLMALETTEDYIYSTHSEDCETQRQKTLDLEKKLSLWKTGKCGECGTDFKHSEDEIALLKQEVATAQSIVSDMYEEKDRLHRLLENQKEIDRKNAEDKKAFEQLQTKVLEMSKEFEGYDPKAYLYKQKQAEGSADLIKKKDEIVRLISEKQEAIALTEKNIATMDATGFKPDDFSQEFLDEYTRKSEKVNEAKEQKSSISTALNLKRVQLEERRKENRLAEMSEHDRKFISDLRSILHVDNYPRLAISLKKGKLGTIINKYLDIFEQPFTININDSLEFVCSFSDNPNVSTDDLSGGQKAMLLVSTRLAIAEMLASDVELLTFDEPGAAMDKDAKQGLLEAFDTVRKYLSGRKIQMLVASHDDNIEQIADSIINL
jgi:DNA repair exonuclease SbcCD ATPase subunit